MGKVCLPLIGAFAPAMLLLVQPAPSNAQAVGSADAPALTVLVRHADRASTPADDPLLTAAGAKRAEDLAAALRDTKFSAIITTQLIRTRDTASPIAAALGIVPEIVAINPGQADAHVKAIEGAVHKHAGEIVLVVNHSNMLPAIVAALGGPRLGPICESIYDDLFILIPGSGKMNFVHSRYGAATPPGPDCPTMQSGGAR